MSNELSVIGDFAEKVREKVKRDFADMIPDDAWDVLVERATKEFVEKDLKGVVREHLKEQVADRLTEFFGSEEWRGQWSEDGSAQQNPGAMTRQLIREALPEVIEAVFGRAAQEFVNNLRYGFNR